MNETEISMLRTLIVALIVGVAIVKNVGAVPLDSATDSSTVENLVSNVSATTVVTAKPIESTEILSANKSMEASPSPSTPPSSSSTPISSSLSSSPAEDLETAGSDKVESSSNFVGTVGAIAEPPDNVASASNINPAIYAGLLSPDAFQHYVSQFGPAAAYVPYGAAYPAPIGYAPVVPPPPPPPAAIYPSPIVVQTGYEGFLVPTTTTASTTSTTTTTASTDTESSTQAGPLALLGQLLPALMMSTLFRIFAAIISTVGMIFFSNAIGTLICNYTPICDMSFQAVSYLRRRGASESVSRMIAEEMTPERVRRATEFVRKAIRKYREMQKVSTGE